MGAARYRTVRLPVPCNSTLHFAMNRPMKQEAMLAPVLDPQTTYVLARDCYLYIACRTQGHHYEGARLVQVDAPAVLALCASRAYTSRWHTASTAGSFSSGPPTCCGRSQSLFSTSRRDGRNALDFFNFSMSLLGRCPQNKVS